ncbi:hypothetical protein ASAC_0256 [Acidilobus saccharovorans 345-15]|uniref:Uncharacterized protein n=1 Tax=Acidilobus saccharovorans (strain DSM 16705 / JCM 18335 / VKM B-2471 / 345-15) TaxID=666510 RepID=D9Q025_ACIS3|nr:hypothetical protein [Acidilobus saccharovorans]ADL18663.1 hypothetical protein ASAC_0256 [Acidilobus saccharovorans 345-15]
MERGASPEGSPFEKSNREIARIMIKLLTNYWLYFTKNEEVNSDGMRLLASALRYAKGAAPQVRHALRESIRRPTLHSVLRVCESLGLDMNYICRLVSIAELGEIYGYGYYNVTAPCWQ